MKCLKNIFEGVLDFFDTTGERETRKFVNQRTAEMLYQRDTDHLILTREFAKRGYAPSEGPENTIHGMIFGTYLPVPCPAFVKADWTPEEQMQAVKEATEALKGRGLSDKEIENPDIGVTHIRVDGRDMIYPG